MNVDDLKQLIEASQRIVVLTGAGISTDSGIRDFRGPNGVWTKNPEAEKMATLQNYMAEPEVRRRAWQSRMDSTVWTAEPNEGHLALRRLDKTGRLLALITQNIDGLHQQAGHDPGDVIEIHGTMREVECLACGYRAPMQLVLDRVRAGEDDPDCPTCSGILKSATISFGQGLREHDLVRAQDAAQSCDLMLAVGSTLAVYPVAGVVPIAKQAGAKIAILNGSPTELDHLADVLVHGSISEALEATISFS